MQNLLTGVPSSPPNQTSVGLIGGSHDLPYWMVVLDAAERVHEAVVGTPVGGITRMARPAHAIVTGQRADLLGS